MKWFKWRVIQLQGVQKKMCRSFCLISPATSIIECWDIIHLKGDIHSFVLSTSSFLCNIKEPRYKQNKKGYEIRRIWNIEQSCWNIYKKILTLPHSKNSWVNTTQANHWKRTEKVNHVKPIFLGPKPFCAGRIFFWTPYSTPHIYTNVTSNSHMDSYLSSLRSSNPCEDHQKSKWNMIIFLSWFN